jgi:hypothetical protein
MADRRCGLPTTVVVGELGGPRLASLVVLFLIVLFTLLGVAERRVLQVGFTEWIRAFWVLPSILVLVLGLLLYSAQSDVQTLRSGTPLSAALDQAFPVSAPCVHVLWLEPPRQQGMPSFDSTHRYFLLGQRGGTTVVFDATVDRSFRIPSENVLLAGCAQ